MFGKGKTKGKNAKGLAAPKASSWAIQGGAADKIIVAEPPSKRRKGDGKDGKGKGKDGKDGKNLIEDKKVDNELQKNQATDAQIEAICELLRSNKVDQALQLMQKELGDVAKANSISVKQLGQLVSGVGLRTPQELALRFFDAVDALGLPKFPTYGAHAYFSRYARWALREFLSEAESAVEQAVSTPAHVLEKTGVCIPMMEA
ncbi:Serine/threonine-protein phosphatase, partial [Durusdinium trenchii]